MEYPGQWFGKITIPLNASQLIGFAKFCERLDVLRLEFEREQKDMNEFLKLCLEENGGDLTKDYEFNAAKREWRLKEPSA